VAVFEVAKVRGVNSRHAGDGRPGQAGILSKVEQLLPDRPQGGFCGAIGGDL
jgi:hypothetical protein